ncbi:murein transglycosylase A [Phaeodactylibacter xiamenensis]|uniref:murein transglycosylase A n=1 Tax=Phaeodactylibacter xiamenensis TaxID=1524460 RepID=UPI003CCC4003
MKIRTAVICLALTALTGCGPSPESGQLPVDTPDARHKPKKLKIDRYGRVQGQPKQQDIYTPIPLDSLTLPIIDGKAVEALQHNLKLLDLARSRSNYQVGNLRIRHEALREVTEMLAAWQHAQPFGMEKYLNAYQIWGRDQRGNVQFTGYFTPVIKVSREPSGPFKYPIYSRPLDWEGALPTRAQIEGEGVLDSMGLELAYAANKVDLYYMQVQGSGYVEYPDGTRELFSYNGSNRHPYLSIEKYIMEQPDLNIPNLSIRGIRKFLLKNPTLTDTILFQNPSYTFFIRQQTVPSGAGNVPLTPGYSIAVDRRYIPLGSCLLAAFPIFDNRKQRVIGHDYRLLIAQDVGGAIRGPGHVDFYTGIGDAAAQEAGNLKSYGKLWLLLPPLSEPKPVSTSLK